MTRLETERSAQRFREWVYQQNPEARKLADPEVYEIKRKLGHYKGLKKKRRKK